MAFRLPFNLQRYNKATALAIGAAATQLVAALTTLDQESVQIVGNALTLFLVWLVPNLPEQPPSSGTSKLPAVMLALLLLGGGLSACAQSGASTDPYVNAVQRYGIACDAFSASLNVLSSIAQDGDLSLGTTRTVDDVVAVVGPICTADRPPIDNLDLIVALETGVTRLIALRQEVAR